MGSIHEIFFCSMDYVPKINTKRDMRCCELPYVTAEGGSRLRATLATFLTHTIETQQYLIFSQ